MRYFFLLLCLCACVGIVGADTAIIYANEDITLSRTGVSESFSDIRNGAGTTLTDDAGLPITLTSSSTTNTFATMRRSLIQFDTAPIGGGSIILSGKITLNVSTKGDNLKIVPNLVVVNYTGGYPFAASDYNKYGSTLLAANVSYNAIVPGTRVDLVLNSAGLNYINKSGNTRFLIRTSTDYNNVFNGTWASSTPSWVSIFSANNGIPISPYLTVEYTVPDTTPPDSITALANSTPSCSTVNFSWTNPADADYNGLEVWRNNTQLANLTASDTFVNWTGLPENTDIVFSSKTFDVTGNVNATFVNLTAHTTTCSVPPTPAPTPTPIICTYLNMTGATVLPNSTNISVSSGTSSWGVNILNATEGNVSYYQCGNTAISNNGGSGSGSGGEAAGIAAGVVGGILGSIIILRRRGESL